MNLDQRIRMNSESLQAAFPEVYRDFFSKNDLVLSTAGAFFWSAGFTVIYGGAGMAQKLPLKIYVGIERDHFDNLVNGSFHAFIPSKQKFEKIIFDNIFQQKYLNLLNKLANTLSRPPKGRINILTEVPIGSDLNVSGATMMTLVCILFVLSGEISYEELLKLTTLSTFELLKNQIFDRMFRMAWKLESLFHADAGSGTGPFAAFIESSSPIIFYSERREGSFSSHPYSRIPSELEGHYELIDKINYSGFRMSDLFKWSSDQPWPIDFGSFGLGSIKNTRVILKPLKIFKENLLNLENFADKYFKDFPVKNYRNTPPVFYEMSRYYKEGRGYWENGVDFLIILSFKAVNEMKNLIERGMQRDIADFCDTVKLEESIYEFFNHGLPIYVPMNPNYELEQQYASIGFRFLPDRAAQGGNLLFVTPQGSIQNYISEIFQKLQTKLSPLVTLNYASWIDGYEKRGISLEQYLDRKIYSPFITKGMVSVREWGPGARQTHHAYSIEEFNERKNLIDLLIDPYDHKIFIQGKCLTSKQLKTSKATIDVIKILLANLGREVKSADLPPSNYIERNEMQSKIVSPLKQAVKKAVDKELPLFIHGGLRKNFSLQLDPSNLIIALVEQKF